MPWLQKHTATLLLITVILLVTVLNAVGTWQQAESPWNNLNNDHDIIGVIFYRIDNPDLYPSDYFFRDNRYTTYYTPSFLALIQLTTPVAGDYYHGLALLQAPVLGLYLIGAFALFWQATHSRALALIFALLSIIGVTALIDFWRLNGLESMLPRTVALPFVVLATFLLIRYLQPGDNRFMNGSAAWHWLLLGLLVGASANLHPTTGIALSLVMGILAVAAWWHHRRPGLLQIVLLVTGVVVAGAPIVLNVSGASAGGEMSSEDFRNLAAAFKWRVRMLPYPINHLGAFSDEAQYAIAILWVVLTIGLWLRARHNHRSWASLGFVAVQLGYTWLLINNVDALIDILMLVTAGAFFVWRWRQHDEGKEMLYYEMIAAIVGVSYVLPLFLHVVWENLQVWSLTTLVAEFVRGARLLTLPFYLIGARFALHLAQHPRRDTVWLVFLALLSVLSPLSVWHGLLGLLLIFRERIAVWRQRNALYAALWSGSIIAVSVYIIHSIVTRSSGTVLALAAGVVTAVACLLVSRVGEPKRWVILSGIAGAVLVILTMSNIISPINFTNDNPWYYNVTRGAPDFITFLLSSVIALGLWLLFRKDDERGFQQDSKTAWWYRAEIFLSVSLVAVMAIQTVGLFRYSLRSSSSDMIPPLAQAALWARDNTDQAALFLVAAGDSSTFRFWSQRSITHGWKELGIVAYSHPADLAVLRERYDRIIAALNSPNDLIVIADELDADYIIRDKDLPLDLTVAYENDALVIYQLSS